MGSIMNFSNNTNTTAAPNPSIDFTTPGWRLEILRQHGLFPFELLDTFHLIFNSLSASSSSPSTPFITPDGAPLTRWLHNHRPSLISPHDRGLYENCFLVWANGLRAGHAGLSVQDAVAPDTLQGLVERENWVRRNVLEPGEVVRECCGEGVLGRFVREYWAQLTYLSGRRIAPMRKNRTVSAQQQQQAQAQAKLAKQDGNDMDMES